MFDRATRAATARGYAVRSWAGASLAKEVAKVELLIEDSDAMIAAVGDVHVRSQQRQPFGEAEPADATGAPFADGPHLDACGRGPKGRGDARHRVRR